MDEKNTGNVSDHVSLSAPVSLLPPVVTLRRFAIWVEMTTLGTKYPRIHHLLINPENNKKSFLLCEKELVLRIWKLKNAEQ